MPEVKWPLGATPYSSITLDETCLDVYAQGGYTEFYTGIENYSVSYDGAVERF